MDIEPITLTEGDLYDIGDTVCEVTREVLEEAMTKQQNVFGALRVQLQELQVWPQQEGTIATYDAASTSAADQLLHAKMANTIVLSEGALTTKSKEDRAAVGRMKGLGLNLATLPWDTLYQLEDGITTELCAREGRVIQVLSEQKINIEQLNMQHDKLAS